MNCLFDDHFNFVVSLITISTLCWNFFEVICINDGRQQIIRTMSRNSRAAMPIKYGKE